jgi:truncated hemoglobin YjbI
VTTPTLYEWAGGHEALLRLTEVFYDKVLADPLLAPVFAHLSDKHREQPGATPPPQAPVPHWGWGEAPPYQP